MGPSTTNFNSSVASSEAGGDGAVTPPDEVNEKQQLPQVSAEEEEGGRVEEQTPNEADIVEVKLNEAESKIDEEEERMDEEEEKGEEDERQKEEKEGQTSSAAASAGATEGNEKSGKDETATAEQKEKEKDVWVSNLASTTRATDLKAFFTKYGNVVGAKVMTNPKIPGRFCGLNYEISISRSSRNL